MRRSFLPALVVGIALAAGPALAQQSRTETVPVQVKRQTVMKVQQELNKKGFDAGHADGAWGPQTAMAVKNFQRKNHLAATGSLNGKTLSKLGIRLASSSSSSSQSSQPNHKMASTSGQSSQSNHKTASSSSSSNNNKTSSSGSSSSPHKNYNSSSGSSKNH